MIFKNLDTPLKILLWLTFLVGIALIANILNVPTLALAFVGGFLGAAFATWIGLIHYD